MTDTTKDDLVNDCQKTFEVIANQFAFNYEPDWLNKLNQKQLTELDEFLNDVLVEIRQ